MQRAAATQHALSCPSQQHSACCCHTTRTVVPVTTARSVKLPHNTHCGARTALHSHSNNYGFILPADCHFVTAVKRSKRLSQKEAHNKTKFRGGGMYFLNLSAQLHYLHGTVQPHNPTIQNPYCLANPHPSPLPRSRIRESHGRSSLVTSYFYLQDGRIGFPETLALKVHTLHLKYTLCD